MHTSELQELFQEAEAEQPPPSPDLWENVVKRARRHRNRRRATIAVTSLAVCAGIATAAVTFAPTHKQVITVGPAAPGPTPTPSTQASTAGPPVPAPTSSVPSSTVPAAITGTQEVLQPATPFDLTQFGIDDPLNNTNLVAGTAHSFTVDGSPTFEVADVTPGSRSPLTASASTTGTGGWTEEAALFYVGVGGTSGTGGDATFTPLAPPSAVTGSPVQIIPNWPVPGKQLYVWTNLPAGTAYVTYTYQGDTLAWQAPVSGTIALLVPRPAAFDGNYATWHSAPLPIMTAYSSSGQVTQVEAPRIGGDDLKVGP